MIETVHTWRDGTFFFRGVMGFSNKDKGAAVVMKRDAALEKLIEVRHLAGTPINSFGHVFGWHRDENGEPVEGFLE